MQFAKDSFYVALRDRLAALDPARTVVVAGRMRPAVLVDENEPANSALPLPNAFHLAWGIPEIVKGAESARRPLMKIDCTIAYRIAGAQSGARGPWPRPGRARFRAAPAHRPAPHTQM